MPTSDEDLQTLQDDVQKLRDQVAAEDAKAAARARGIDNDIAAAQLTAEKVRLETQLAQSKEAAKVGSVKAGASAPLQSAQQLMELAVAQQKAVEDLRTADAKAAETPASKEPAPVVPVVADTAATKGAPDAERSN